MLVALPYLIFAKNCTNKIFAKCDPTFKKIYRFFVNRLTSSTSEHLTFKLYIHLVIYMCYNQNSLNIIHAARGLANKQERDHIIIIN